MKKSLLRGTSVFLFVIFALSLLSVSVFAESPAVVTGDYVNVRTGPGTNYDRIGIQLNKGHSVTVLESAPDAKGGSIPWYKISFWYNGTSHIGYMRSDYVAITPSLPPDLPPMEEENTDFEAQLAAFPEDYKPALQELHRLHPAWNFEAFYTDLDWNAVQDLENRLGWSYINDGVISHYSTAPGSYDWETDTYFVREGSNWYQAHPAMVAYFMDPRNFLNETDIFQFERLAFSSTQTEDTIAQMLQGTFMEGKSLVNNQGEPVSYARAFLDAATSANVSAFHLVARCIQEIGWSGNACAWGSYPGYEGYYNFFNIGAKSGATDGMIYAKDKGWNTPYKAILAGGAFIGNNYIARGQNTPYFQKYNVVEKNNVAGHQYMTNVAAARSEGRIQKNKYANLGMLETGFTFSIPVYNGIPASPCAAPTPTGSPNNLLKSLSVDGYSLAPTFDLYDTLNNGTSTYTLRIVSDSPIIYVNALPAGKAATVSGSIGEISLSEGENRLVITCTAANGDVRHYTIIVAYERPTPLPPTPEIPPEDRELGDLDGVGGKNIDDAIYLLYHVNFPQSYPICQFADYDHNGTVDIDDAIYMLYHVNFPETYPLQ